ncbi:chaperone modulator CbpM [Flavivirga sp. 57AJ16]|uniref:chaperone modulator CbpM n=1 Tax=Flavivirga sp. 57AJ16 TaxID=3025307 RepID=UPI002366648F|nr:chaperone modulator CbpM [Flavivirga sp. 57AJ16]MDD7884914.1 chaperone modulator CbpM [Flavivirga sp. 57AJ16]
MSNNWYYNIPQSFVNSLSHFDLIDLIELERVKYVEVKEIDRIEKLMRIHYDLNVNFEGIDIIDNLLNQINTLRDDIINLKNEIDFYK